MSRARDSTKKNSDVTKDSTEDSSENSTEIVTDDTTNTHNSTYLRPEFAEMTDGISVKLSDETSNETSAEVPVYWVFILLDSFFMDSCLTVMSLVVNTGQSFRSPRRRLKHP